ncbi:hypothetical protein KR767_01540 [Luteibacter anthropi]|uniref:hypothetical protein n=1 Tax=Luteibacter anthropi TaxID=564369 RepID=UPI002032F204|nr:hypothetical protein [Luteibacter anthropi]URX62782.1 hypothetical protein KR767_01540 [Luteibacter anthropi]
MIDLFERSRATRGVILLAIIALTALVYASGLQGPYLIDDAPNLDTIQRWVDGRLDWRSAIDNHSGPLGRPVSMLTFLMDAARSGAMYPEPLKTTNLVIHILCGVLVYTLCRQLLRRAEVTRAIASTAALFLAAWWLLLPLHVSTVLYIIQRMAQLGALFSLLSLTLYVYFRQGVERKPRPLLYLGLWIIFPLVVGIGALAKENAVLAIPLAMLVEAVFFPATKANPRPRLVTVFFFLTVILPGVLIAGWLVFHPELIVGGYQGRPFTLGERLLTEPRVLWSYVKTMLMPAGQDMGLFHDNYVLSTSWFAPWTTAIAILAWLLAVIVAITTRRKHPLVSFGIGFFLIGHLLESTIVPLEIYFEHRNYLPDLGILMALVGIGRALWLRHPHPTIVFRRTVMLCPVLIVALYATATWVQVGSWSNVDTLFEMQAAYNPTSPRLQATLAAQSVERGDTRTALAHIALEERFRPPSEGMNATIWRIIAYSAAKAPVPETLYEEFEQRTNLPITMNSMRYWERLAELAEMGRLNAKRLAEAGRRWIDHDASPATSQLVWRSRYNLARMYGMSGNLVQAESQAHRAWIDSDYNTGIGVLLFQLNASLGRSDACEAILDRLRLRANTGDADLVEAIKVFSKALADGTIRASSASH